MVSAAQRSFYSLCLRPLSVKRHLSPLSLRPFLSPDAYFLVPLCQCLVAGAFLPAHLSHRRSAAVYRPLKRGGMRQDSDNGSEHLT